MVPSLPADVGGFSPVEGCAVYLRERFELERIVLGERGRRASLPAPRIDVAGREREGVPVVFLDFDGVLNALPGIDDDPADAGDSRACSPWTAWRSSPGRMGYGSGGPGNWPPACTGWRLRGRSTCAG